MSGAAESEIVALREQIVDLRSVIEEQASRIDLLLKERAEDRQRLAELEEYRADNEHDKAMIRQQVTKAEEASNADAENDESSLNNDSITPMDRVLKFGASVIMGTVTASVERAKAMGQHFEG